MDRFNDIRRDAERMVREAVRLWIPTEIQSCSLRNGVTLGAGDESFFYMAGRAYYDEEFRRCPHPPQMPDPVPRRGEHVVYEAISVSNRALYVGVTSCFRGRMAAHASSSRWWKFADEVHIVYRGDDRRSAEWAEANYIDMWKPPFNRAGVLL